MPSDRRPRNTSKAKRKGRSHTHTPYGLTPRKVRNLRQSLATRRTEEAASREIDRDTDANEA